MIVFDIFKFMTKFVMTKYFKNEKLIKNSS